MKKIEIRKLYDLYLDTLSRLGTYLLDEDSETIEYNVFEEADIGVHSFLHFKSLEKLHKEGLISKEKLLKSLELREKFLKLQCTNEWNIDDLKSSKKWKELLLLSDEINLMK